MEIKTVCGDVFELDEPRKLMKPVYYVMHIGTLKLLKSFQLSTIIPEWTNMAIEAHTFPSIEVAHTTISESLSSCWRQCDVVGVGT